MPWFIKTERFLRPYAQMKPHLEAHRRWVEQRRAEGVVLSSGYLVDGEGCLLYTSPSPRDATLSRMPSSA